MNVSRTNILNIDGVAEYTTLAKSTIYKKISLNEIPYHHVGGRTLFVKEEIDNWIKNDGKMVGDLPTINLFKN
jgi:excisionase family DNA binding protein